MRWLGLQVSPLISQSFVPRSRPHGPTWALSPLRKGGGVFAEDLPHVRTAGLLTSTICASRIGGRPQPTYQMSGSTYYRFRKLCGNTYRLGAGPVRAGLAWSSAYRHAARGRRGHNVKENLGLTGLGDPCRGSLPPEGLNRSPLLIRLGARSHRDRGLYEQVEVPFYGRDAPWGALRTNLVIFR